MSVVLDAVTGLPLDDSYLTQYQIPLGSQPINLEELGALGRQSNWLYPDNLPGVVSRLQARDNTNPLNAQDLSTDGKRNLNVHIASGDPGNGVGYQISGAGRIQETSVSVASDVAINTFDTSGIPQYLYQLSLGMIVTSNFSGDDFGRVDVWLDTDTPTVRVPMWSGILTKDGVDSVANISLVFSPPLALNRIYNNDTADTLYLYCHSYSFGLLTNCCLRNSL